MVRFRTRLVAVTCAVAMVGSFWGSAGAIVSADASEPSAEMAWSITTDNYGLRKIAAQTNWYLTLAQMPSGQIKFMPAMMKVHTQS